MKILITICARGGSKGIPGKNIKPLNGQPLIGYSIAVAKEFQSVFEGTDIMLSTDSEEIIRVAGVCGLKSDYKRPEYLANDTVGKIDAIKDLVLYSESKQGQIYDFLRSDENAINLFSVSEAGRSPYFNMVEQKENGYYAQVKMPDNNVFTRQSAPQVYDLNASFYFYKRSFFDMGYKGAITDRSLVYKVPHICFDLDHPIDFEIISYLMSNNKLDFLL